MTEPNKQDLEALDQAISDVEWVQRQATVAETELKRQLDLLSGWRHPILWIRSRYALARLRQVQKEKP